MSAAAKRHVYATFQSNHHRVCRFWDSASQIGRGVGDYRVGDRAAAALPSFLPAAAPTLGTLLLHPSAAASVSPMRGREGKPQWQQISCVECNLSGWTDDGKPKRKRRRGKAILPHIVCFYFATAATEDRGRDADGLYLRRQRRPKKERTGDRQRRVTEGEASECSVHPTPQGGESEHENTTKWMNENRQKTAQDHNPEGMEQNPLR